MKCECGESDTNDAGFYSHTCKETTQDRLARLEARLAEIRDVLEDTELNMGNYSFEGVQRLNDAAIEVYGLASPVEGG